jgi:hypothetical protein
MTTRSDSPIVFISYSWSPITNKNWVLDFAERLSRDGINIIIDEWDAKEGQDKFDFMEQMVNREDVGFVLLICNKDYAEKANKKKGGVGIESQIVSSEIYNKVRQEKFIPIVREYNESVEPYLPTFLKSRFFIDLCEGNSFEENYELLLRRLFDKPKRSRPPIGTPPGYLLAETPIFLKTAHKKRPLMEAILYDKPSTNGLIQDFFNAFFDSLLDHRFDKIEDPNNPPIDELIIERLNPLKLLRDEFLEIIDTLLRYNKIDDETLFQFFENLVKHSNKDISDPYYDFNEHIQILIHEIFIYTATLLIKIQRFETLSILLNRPYPVERTAGRIEFEYYCGVFNEYCQYLDRYRNSRLKLNRVSVTADIIMERLNNKFVSKDELIDTDLILHYAGLLLINQSWFPRLSIYRRYWNPPVFIQKMQSKRFFEKIKVLFGVQSANELSDKITQLDKSIYNGIRTAYYSFPQIFNVFDISNIGKIN